MCHVCATGIGIQIVDPDEESLEVRNEETLNLKCEGGPSSSPEWQHNGMTLTASTPGGRIIITDVVDIDTGNK